MKAGGKSVFPVFTASQTSEMELADDGGSIHLVASASHAICKLAAVSMAMDSSASNFSTCRKGNHIISHLM